MSNTGFIHSIQSMGTVDGPGVRTVVFLAGCPLRCIYCHNPDTWTREGAEEWNVKALADKILRYKPYIKDGGVTFSGGEPCLQAAFLYELASILKDHGLHIALDTSGAVLNEDVKKLLTVTDLVLLDVKMTNKEDYVKYIGQDMETAIDFLNYLESQNLDTWIRHVIVPGINDSESDICALSDIIKGYSCVRRVELLPFRKLCLEKYKNMGILFPLENTPEMSNQDVNKLNCFLQ